MFEDEYRESGGFGRRRILAVAALLALLLLIGWLVYALAVTLGGRGQPSAASTPLDPAPVAGVAAGEVITLLSALDTTALHAAGRGTAEIVNQSDLEMIRLRSVRAPERLGEPAEPIIVTFEPGVIERLEGRRATVEILARSGGAGPATLAIQCVFDGKDACGRKRFRIGIQPEEIVFTLSVPKLAGGKDEPHLAINTDITGAASLTGQGDPVDILHARIRITGE